MSEPVTPCPMHPLEAILLPLCRAADPKKRTVDFPPRPGFLARHIIRGPWRVSGRPLAGRTGAEGRGDAGNRPRPDAQCRRHRGVLDDPAALRRLNEGRAVFPAVRGCVVREAVRRPRRPVVTWLLIGLNLAGFAYTLFLASSNTALFWAFLRITPFSGGADRPGVAALVERAGGVFGADWVHGEWPRLATSCFVHVGIFHLLVNLIALYRVGAEVEQMWGRLRYLLIYARGPGRGLLPGPRRCEPQAASAGASGALCGVIAAAAVWWVCNGHCLPRALARELRVNLLINGVLITLISLVPGVSGWGHLGGALTGAAAALALQAQRRFAAAVVALGERRWAPARPAVAARYAVIERQRATDPDWAPFNAAPAPHRLTPKLPR